MLTIRLSSLATATALAIAMVASIEAPQAEALYQQTDAPLLGASLDTSQDVTLAQNDGRRGGRGERARDGRGGGDGARGGRGGRGNDGARGGRGPRAGGAVLPNESGGMRTATVPNGGDPGGRGAGGGRGGNDAGIRGGRGGGGDGTRGGRGGGAYTGSGGRGGRNDGARGGRGGGTYTGSGGRGGRGDTYRGGHGDRNDTYRGTRGGRNDVYRGTRGGQNDTYRGTRGGRNDVYRGTRGGHNNVYRGGRDVRVNRYSGYRGGHTFRDSRGSYRRGYVNGRLDAQRYYGNYRRPVRNSWRYHARYYDRGYNSHNYRYYDRGCRSNGDQVLAGAILGALFGVAVADDDAAGALVGGFFGAGIGSALNACDRGQLHYAVSYSFANNSPYYWHNPHSGVRGVVYARDYYTVGNRRCRWGDAEIYMPDGSFVIDEVRMCQDAYGRWQVANYQ